MYRAHPLTCSVQLDISEIQTAHTGVLIHTHDIPFFLEEKLTTLILADTRICLISTQEGITLQNSRPIAIPSDTLIVHTTGTWSGDKRPSPKTRNHDTLYILPHRHH